MAEINYEPLTHLSQGYVVARVIENGKPTNQVVVVDKSGNPTRKIKNKTAAENLLKINCDAKGFSVTPFKNGVAMIKYRTPAQIEKVIGLSHSGYVMPEDTCEVAEAVYKKPEMLQQLELKDNPDFSAEELNGLFDVAKHKYSDLANDLESKRAAGEISQEEFNDRMQSNLDAAKKTAMIAKEKLQAVADKKKEASANERGGEE